MKENKNKIIATVVAILVVLAIIITIIVVSNKKEEIPVISKDKLSDTITEYLMNEDKAQNEENYKDYSDFKTFINLKIIGIELDGNKTYVYAWALIEDYYIKEDVATLGSGSSMAYKFTIKNDKVAKCENPEDGDGYSKSMKSLFPEEVYEKLIKINGAEELINGLKEQVKEYYGDKYNSEEIVMTNEQQ